MPHPPDPLLSKNDACSRKELSFDMVIDKIKIATLRVGFNLWNIFKEVDDYKTNYIPESKFLSILLGPLKHIIGLNRQEIHLLLYKLRAVDGRIAYTQLCRLVHEGEDPPHMTDEEKQREDQYTSIQLSPKEEERILEILSKIAVTVPPQKMILKPFFQDFELIRRGSGQLSRNTFLRVLTFIGVDMSDYELKLLYEKYRYDAFTIKYNAFLKDLNKIYQYLIDHGYMDNAGNYRAERMDDDSDILPKPELGEAPRGEKYGIMKVWSRNCLGQTTGLEGSVAFRKIYDHVRREQIRVEDFFKHFDEDGIGRVAKDIAKKCMKEWLTISERNFNNLYIAPWEAEMICKIFEDPKYKDKFLWKVFMDDLERGIPEEELDTWPRRGLERTPLNPFEVLYRPPTPPESTESTLVETLDHMKNTLGRIPKPERFFNTLDKYLIETDSFIVPRRKFDWTLLENGILLSKSEMEQIFNHYGRDGGLDWRALSHELRENPPTNAINEMRCQLRYNKEQAEKSEQLETEFRETNIVEVLAKIKTKAICKRIWLKDSLKLFDGKNKQLVTRDDFQRGLHSCGIVLTPTEMETVLDVFALPENPSMIEYMRFCKCVDEDSLPPCLVRLPLEEAMAKEEAKEKLVLPTHQYINFEARIVLGKAIDKLAKYINLANTDFFKSLDKENTGTVNKLEFQRALYKLNCLHLISNRELDTIVNSFGITKGLEVELDYMAFLNAMDITHMTKKAAKTA